MKSTSLYVFGDFLEICSVGYEVRRLGNGVCGGTFVTNVVGGWCWTIHPVGLGLITNLYICDEGTRPDSQRYQFHIRRDAIIQLPAASYLSALPLI